MRDIYTVAVLWRLERSVSVHWQKDKWPMFQRCTHKDWLNLKKNIQGLLTIELFLSLNTDHAIFIISIFSLDPVHHQHTS